MYVIRFSKINIAQVSSVTLEDKIRLSLCQERENKIAAPKTELTQYSYINPS